jgi:hypothetical protein
LRRTFSGCEFFAPHGYGRDELFQYVITRPDHTGQKKEVTLMIGKSLSAAAALALGFIAAPASAAPMSNLQGVTTDSTIAEQVHYGGRCWRHYRYWHCRPHYRRYYYSYYPYRPYYYYGYAPAFRFYVGPRRWHRHWWW